MQCSSTCIWCTPSSPLLEDGNHNPSLLIQWSHPRSPRNIVQIYQPRQFYNIQTPQELRVNLVGPRLCYCRHVRVIKEVLKVFIPPPDIILSWSQKCSTHALHTARTPSSPVSTTWFGVYHHDKHQPQHWKCWTWSIRFNIPSLPQNAAKALLKVGDEDFMDQGHC